MRFTATVIVTLGLSAQLTTSFSSTAHSAIEYFTTKGEISCLEIAPATKGRAEAIRKASDCWTRKSKIILKQIASRTTGNTNFPEITIFKHGVNDASCWRLGFHHVCRISAQAKAQIDVKTHIFHKPEWQGYRLDWCYEWGKQCGRPAADELCRRKGFSPVAVSFEIDNRIGKITPTKTMSSGRICPHSSCDGFQFIICQRRNTSLE